MADTVAARLRLDEADGRVAFHAALLGGRRGGHLNPVPVAAFAAEPDAAWGVPDQPAPLTRW
ncbi:hypothetical protein ACFYTS_10275 [Nocardia sp. NPDC004151]|uniref:hypothetical protein n=1 Tax=Nocardia sp. NPDC004151 TaxID=3364304 RepID=UPI003695E769